MKTKLFFIAAFTGVMLLAGCAGGPSEATKKEVAAFDSAWGIMSQQAMAFGDSVKTALSKCEGCCKMDTSMCCKHMAAKMDSAMGPCKNDMKNFQDIKTAMEGAKPMWDETATAFAAFKEKVNKGEIKDEEAKKQLSEFQSKADAGNKAMQEWMAKFNDAKTACMKNMENCMMACKDMKCSDKNCKKMKDKEKKM